MVRKWCYFTAKKESASPNKGFWPNFTPPKNLIYIYLSIALYCEVIFCYLYNFEVILFVLILILIFCTLVVLNIFFTIKTHNYWISSKKSKNPLSNFLWSLFPSASMIRSDNQGSVVMTQMQLTISVIGQKFITNQILFFLRNSVIRQKSVTNQIL